MSKPNKTDRLTILDVCPVSTEVIPNGGIIVSWCGDIGFGEWTLYWGDDGKLHADTEYLDRHDDRAFTEEILKLLAEQIVID